VDTRSEHDRPRTGTILTGPSSPTTRRLLPASSGGVKDDRHHQCQRHRGAQGRIPKASLGPFVYVGSLIWWRGAAGRMYRELADGWIVAWESIGDRIVVDGVIRVRPGNPVKTSRRAAGRAPKTAAGAKAISSKFFTTGGLASVLSIRDREAGWWRLLACRFRSYTTIVTPEVLISATTLGAHRRDVAATVASRSSSSHGVEALIYIACRPRPARAR